MKKIILALILLIHIISCAEARVLPLSNDLRGSVDFTWFIFDVYSAKLWASKNSKIYSEPLSLELTYKRDLKGTDIAQRSISELEGQGHRPSFIKKWRKDIFKIFPNIRKGDSILANYSPINGLRFYLNRFEFLGAIENKFFAIAFMNIWLGEKTSEPDFREKLLGTNL